VRGADVVLALDCRTERMKDGVNPADLLGLTNLRFEKSDIRTSILARMECSTSVLLGILYNLNFKDVF
jgi:hypothetical protein